MSEKPSGNDPEPPEEDSDASRTEEPVPIGEEVTVDPAAGYQLDPVDRWWDAPRDPEDMPRNRRLDPEEWAEHEAARKQEEARREKQMRERAATAAPEDENPRAKTAEDDTAGDGSWLDEVESIGEPAKKKATDDPDPPAAVLPEDAPPEPEPDRPSIPVDGGRDEETTEKPEAEEIDAATPSVEGDSGEDGGEAEPAVPRPESARRRKTPPPLPTEAPEPDDESMEEAGISGDSESELPPRKGALESDGSEEGDGDEGVPEADESEREPTSESAQPDDRTEADESKAGEGADSDPGEIEGKEDADGERDSGDSEPSEAASERVKDDGPEPEAAEARAGAAVAAPRRKAGCWTVFTTLFFCLALLLLVVVVGAVAYAWTQRGSVEERIASRVTEALESRGIYADYGGWSYRFPRGIVIRDVTLYETQVGERPVLEASDVGVNVDFLGWFREREAIEGAEISFDDSRLVLYQAGEEICAAEPLDGEILVGPGKVEVRRLAAGLGGVRLEAVGEILLGSSDGRDPAGEDAGEEGGTAAEPEPILLDFSPLRRVMPYLVVEGEGEPPVVEVDFRYDPAKIEEMQLSGRISGRDFTWRNVAVRSLATSVEFDPVEKVADFPSFQLGYGEGLVTGAFSLNTDSRVLTIDEMQSSIDPIAFASDWDAGLAEKLTGLEMVDAPLIRAKGTLPLENYEQADLVIGYDHRMGFSYRTEDRVLPIKDLRGSLTFAEGILESNDFAASILGGTVAMNGGARLNADPIPFSGLIEISEMSLEEVGDYFAGENPGLSGELFLDFRGIGYTEMEKIRGGGNLRIDNAKLTGFPVVGDVQGFLGKILPVFGLEGEGSVRGSYIVESGILLSNDLTVSQGGAVIETSGSLKLEHASVSFTSKARLEEALAAATGLEGREVVVSGEGPFDDPTLRLDGFPVQFAAEELGSVLGTSPESLLQLRDALGSEAQAAEVLGEQLEETAMEELGVDLGEEVGGLLQGLLEGAEPEADEGGADEPASGGEGSESE